MWLPDSRLELPAAFNSLKAPEYRVKIDWSDPVTYGLRVYLLFNYVNLVNLAKPANIVKNAKPIITRTSGDSALRNNAYYYYPATYTKFTVAAGAVWPASVSGAVYLQGAAVSTYMFANISSVRLDTRIYGHRAFTSDATIAAGDKPRTVVCFDDTNDLSSIHNWTPKEYQVVRDHNNTSTETGTPYWRLTHIDSATYPRPYYFAEWDRYLSREECDIMIYEPFRFLVPV